MLSPDRAHTLPVLRVEPFPATSFFGDLIVDISYTDLYIFLKYDLEDSMKEFIRVMKALSDPTRVKIIKILEKRLMCVCELQTAIGAAQSTTSKHLKIL